MEKLTRDNIKKHKNGSGIYHITVERHNYIGSSVDLRSRLRNHIWAMTSEKHRNIIVQNCYNKYGLDKFYFEILEYCEKDIRIEREKYYINLFNPDLNVTDPVSLKRDKTFSQHVSISKKAYYKTHITTSRIPIYQYTIAGDYIAEFSSATEVAKLFSIEVSAVCAAVNGRSKTCKGFQWRKEKFEKIESLVKEKIKVEKPKLLPKPGNRKQIFRYSYDGTYIDSFNSASEADRTLGIKGCSAAARGNGPYRSVGGFLWSYEKVEKLSPYENHSKDAKKVAIILTEINTRKEYQFDSIATAVRTLFPNATNFECLCANISACARGKSKTVRNQYTAKYK